MQIETPIFSVFKELLGLPDIKILQLEDKKSDGYLIRVKNIKTKILCRQCGKPTQPYGTGRTISLRHLPLCGKKVTIEITPLRGQCLNCEGNPTTTQQVDWYDSKSTY